jgi:hypothetical protein
LFKKGIIKQGVIPVWGTIIGSVISAVTAIVVCMINANANHKKLISELEKHDELQAYRIEQLEKKQDKHNNLIERTFILEEKIKVANHRIDDLERKD